MSVSSFFFFFCFFISAMLVYVPLQQHASSFILFCFFLFTMLVNVQLLQYTSSFIFLSSSKSSYFSSLTFLLNVFTHSFYISLFFPICHSSFFVDLCSTFLRLSNFLSVFISIYFYYYFLIFPFSIDFFFTISLFIVVLFVSIVSLSLCRHSK